MKDIKNLLLDEYPIIKDCRIKSTANIRIDIKTAHSFLTELITLRKQVTRIQTKNTELLLENRELKKNISINKKYRYKEKDIELVVEPYRIQKEEIWCKLIWSSHDLDIFKDQDDLNSSTIYYDNKIRYVGNTDNWKVDYDTASRNDR